MRVLHVVPSFYPAVRYGGPIVSVMRLAQAVQGCGAEVDVATTNADGPADLDVPTNRWVDRAGIRVRYFARYPRVDYACSLGLARFLATSARDYDVVHVTSTFSFPATAAAWAARRARVPYLVSPRGSLQGWSLSQKKWKKAPYWWVLEHAQLLRAAAIHATADIEEADVRRLLPKSRIVVVPNGVDVPAVQSVERVPRRVVFLGRLHRKKGFDVLVPALSRLAARIPDVETIIAGPDDDGEWARVERLLLEANPRPNVKYMGAVHGDDKYRLLASATAFVLPSHSENFGQAVVEALACGTPVVVSKNCPWKSVDDAGAGAWVDNTPNAVADALARILSDVTGARSMQIAARSLAAQFSWSAVGQRMLDHYREILGNRRTG